MSFGDKANGEVQEDGNGIKNFERRLVIVSEDEIKRVKRNAQRHESGADAVAKRSDKNHNMNGKSVEERYADKREQEVWVLLAEIIKQSEYGREHAEVWPWSFVPRHRPRISRCPRRSDRRGSALAGAQIQPASRANDGTRGQRSSAGRTSGCHDRLWSSNRHCGRWRSGDEKLSIARGAIDLQSGVFRPGLNVPLTVRTGEFDVHLGVVVSRELPIFLRRVNLDCAATKPSRPLQKQPFCAFASEPVCAIISALGVEPRKSPG
jgi:hypothetical protein